MSHPTLQQQPPSPPAALRVAVPAVWLSLALPARLSGQLFAGLLVLVAGQISIQASRARATR